jgi:hypothetical protein
MISTPSEWNCLLSGLQGVCSHEGGNGNIGDA